MKFATGIGWKNVSRAEGIGSGNSKANTLYFDQQRLAVDEQNVAEQQAHVLQIVARPGAVNFQVEHNPALEVRQEEDPGKYQVL